MTIVFTEYELIYHYCWSENVGQVKFIFINTKYYPSDFICFVIIFYSSIL